MTLYYAENQILQETNKCTGSNLVILYKIFQFAYLKSQEFHAAILMIGTYINPFKSVSDIITRCDIVLVIDGNLYTYILAVPTVTEGKAIYYH